MLVNPDKFQTHPCGVEVSSLLLSPEVESGFRRTLVGLKCFCALTGLKSCLVSDAPLWG